MRDFHVVNTRTKNELYLFVPSLEENHLRYNPRHLPPSVPPAGRPQTLPRLLAVTATDSCSSTTISLIPPPSSHAAHLRWQVQNRRGNRERRLWYVVSILFPNPRP